MGTNGIDLFALIMSMGAFSSLWMIDIRRKRKMSEKTFDCVIDTHSKEERKNLIDYITNKDGFIISNIDDFEGFQLVGVARGRIGFLGVIVSHDLVKNHGYKHFASVDEYISYSEGK